MKLKYQMRGLGLGIIVTALLMGVAMGKGIPLSDAEIKAKALELGMVESDSIRLTDLANASPAPEGAVSPEEGGENDSGGAGTSENASGADGTDGLGNPSGTSGSSDNISGVNGADSEENGSGDGTSGSASESGVQTGSGAGSESGASSEQDTDAGAGSGNAASDTGGEDGGDSSSEGNGNHSEGDAVTVVIEFGVTSSHVSEMLEEAGLVENAAGFDNYLCNNGYSRSITAGTYEIMPGTSEEEIVKIITKTR